MWCEHCQKEFESEEGICPDCGHEPQKLVLVATANDEIEAEIISAKLEAAGIPVLPRYRENGAYLKVYMGNSNFGVDLYVPGSAQKEALEILNTNEISPEDILEEDLALTEETVKGDQKNMTLFTLGVLVVLVAAVFLFVNFMD